MTVFQTSAALLDACVLSVVERGDTYGYMLTQTLRDVLGVSESTLYPVLRRLQQAGLLVTYDQPYQGRNRRYYSITPGGRQQAGIMRADWQDYKSRIDALIDGASEGQGGEAR
jgi:PadR family transcriptional regulator PadR